MASPTLWRDPAPLLLASTSAVRRALVEAAGIPVETEAPGVDERAAEIALPIPDRTSDRLAVALARLKAEAVATRRPGRAVVGADQVLDLDGEAVPKPSSAREAAELLGRLSGRTHVLRSAVALARDGRILAAFSEAAELTMRVLDPSSIAAYLDAAGAAATRSAGGYEIEGLGIHLFERVAGEHTTILGLPMLPLLARLRALGLLGI